MQAEIESMIASAVDRLAVASGADRALIEPLVRGFAAELVVTVALVAQRTFGLVEQESPRAGYPGTPVRSGQS